LRGDGSWSGRPAIPQRTYGFKNLNGSGTPDAHLRHENRRYGASSCRYQARRDGPDGQTLSGYQAYPDRAAECGEPPHNTPEQREDQNRREGESMARKEAAESSRLASSSPPFPTLSTQWETATRHKPRKQALPASRRISSAPGPILATPAIDFDPAQAFCPVMRKYAEPIGDLL